MQSREREFHLGFDAGDLGRSEASSLSGGVPDERRFADPSLAADDQDRALAAADSLKQPVEHFPLPGPAQKRRRALDGHPASLTPVDKASQNQGGDPGNALVRPRVIAAKVAE